MILTLMFLAMLFIGIILATIYINVLDYDGEWLGVIGAILISIGAFGGFISLLVIILAHIGVDADIQKSKIDHYGLVSRYELINTEYEDMSKSDVIKDITEWNKKVYSSKRWGKSPWTNWFYPQQFVDQLEYIDIGGRWSY